MTQPDDGMEPPLAAWLQADFGLRVDEVVAVDGGVDRQARLWRVREVDGRAFAVKWTAGGSAAGLTVARTLADAGVDGVVAPLAAADGRPWSDRAGRRLVVLPWVDGPVALRAGLDAHRWEAFGRLLAAVHGTPLAGLPNLPASDRPHEGLRHRAAALHRALDAASDHDPAAPPHDDLVTRVVDEAPRLRAVVDALLAGADRLHDRGGWAGSGPRVPCHADPHLGNVLVDEVSGVRLLDWDDAVAGPPEQDLLFVLDGGVLAFAPVTTAQRQAFFAGYGPVDLDREALAYHRSLRALEDVVDFALEVLTPDRHTRADREAASGYLHGNLVAGGLTEAALRSLTEVGLLPRAPTLRQPQASPGGCADA